MGEDQSFSSYIHLVHHLIEKCLLHRMTKEESMEALSKHANIAPLITSTVWNELKKENKEWFESYAAQSSTGAHGSSRSEGKEDTMSQEDMGEMIRKTITHQPADPAKSSNE